jgi:hypothetical protein
MISARSLGKAFSLLGAAAQLSIVAGMAPPDWRSRGLAREERSRGGHGPELFLAWAPHFENLGEGRAAFRGGRCPGRQETGVPFRIDDAPLPEGYDPHGFPKADVVACVRLDSRGAVQRVQLVNGTGSAPLDRRLLRTLFRHWRFVPADGGGNASAWQRIRLNSADRSTPPLPPAPEPFLL